MAKIRADLYESRVAGAVQVLWGAPELGRYAMLRQWFDATGWMLAFNVFINGYSIMLQRYNRSKLQGLIQQQRRRRVVARQR